MERPSGRARAIFDRALDIESPQERAAYLDTNCAGAPELRREVEALLQAHADAGRFLPGPAVESSAEFKLHETAFVPPDTPPNAPPQPPWTAGPAQDWVGRSLGKYRVTGVLGQGGMGVVLKAHDPMIERDVAIKVLTGHLASDATALARFLAEARAAGKLNHPNVIAIYEILQEGPTYYLVLEYAPGGSLSDQLERQESLPVLEATQVLIDACKGVGAAHAAGLIHRDIKPANFMRAADGSIKVADFGLAKAAADTGRHLTETGMVIGTPSFMSPEQCQAKPLDPRSDLYSLGATYYSLLTGQYPYQDADSVFHMLYLHCHGPIPDPRSVNPAVPEACSRIIARAMAKAPADRYPSAGAMLADLQAVTATLSGPLPVETPTAPPRATPPASPRPDAPAPPSSRLRAREAERRQVTVLVCGCDLFESEAFLENLDAEGRAKVLRAFRQACEQAVRRLDGTVVQCNEQGLVACFGYPVAYEDGARRAARTGLGVLEDLEALGEQLRREQKLELNLWVGLHTGPAVVEAGEEAVALAGEARNVAVRLGHVAAPRQVTCTEATHRLIRGQFQCASLGPRKITGVAQPLELFQVQGVGEARSPLEAAGPAGLTPLTGRDHEISLLQDRWEQAQEGMGQVVLLIGEPGLGKSRLVYALKQHVLERTGEAAAASVGRRSTDGGEATADSPVVEWRCSPHFQNTGLYPAGEFFERFLGFRRDEAPAARFDRLVRHLGEYDLARPDVVPLFASLLSLPADDRFPPLDLPPVRQREETFRALGDWVRAHSARRPVLFILEDLHWVDASTLEFLGRFLGEGLHDRILTVLTFRPEFQTPWPALAHQTSLALTRLTRRQVGELMRKKTGGPLPEALVEQVYDRAGGVPLFVEEFTKMVQELGAPDPAGEGSTPAHSVLARAIPATLQDLVMARLDRLEGDREVAQVAATLGREFSYELLAAVVPMGEPALQAELAKLVQAEILYPRGRPPRCTYLFKHALLEDALYNALVTGKRQQFHRRVAEALERRFPQTAETQPELLAHHCTEAGLTDQAVGYWLRAGLRARERSADVEAIGHLTKGLDLLDTLDGSPGRDAQQLQLLNPLGTAYLSTRGYAAPEVGPVFRRAREVCARIGQPPQLFAVIWGTFAWHVVRGDFRLCTDLAAEARDLADRLHDPGVLMQALFLQGLTLLYRGDFAGARDHCGRAIADYDDRERTKFWATHTGEDAGVTHRCYLALAWWHLGFPDRALQVNREALELARAIGHPFSLEYALHHTGWLHQYCRLGAQAQAAGDEAIRIATKQGFRFWHASGTLYQAAGLLLQGRRGEGLPLLRKGLDAYRATGAGLALPYYLSILGDAYTQAGQFEDARRTLDEGLALAEKNDDRSQEAELHRLQGELLLAESSDPVAAEGCFRQAIRVARRQQSRAWELRATTSLARLRQRHGRRDEARSALAAVHGTYTEGFTTPDVVDATALLEALA
jgi:serine/threonine protein kinase/tetratricopeptide (TPR) repeat protein